ncbi:MAG: hypothetical protein V4618_06255 [Pseudomonadota bacterium]
MKQDDFADFLRPDAGKRPVSREYLDKIGVDLEADFPGSTPDDFMEYPVLSEGGWFIVVKHQRTLVTVSKKPWRLLGPITLLSDSLDFD